MIQNKRQYIITRAEASRFQEAVSAARSAPPNPGVDPLFLRAEIDGLQSQLDEMLQDIQAYECLRDKQGCNALEGVL